MSRKKLYVTLIVPVLLLIGLWQAAQIAAQVASQDASGDLFTPVRTIGQSRPSGLRYDPNFDRFAWVDSQGQLVLVNAATKEMQHVLYPNGEYNAFSFSRDGRTLAVAFGTRVDIWDTGSGTRVATFAPTGAIRVQGPLKFTLNDELLAFDTIVPAPQELRRSENDTVILPWVWDVAAAREQRTSVLVNRVIAYPFYNVRVSMVAGDNGILVSGLDQRLQVYDADTPTMELIADLPADRLETDAISAWRSATDPYLYVSLNQNGEMAQINTQTKVVNIIELGYDLDLPALDSLKNFSLSRAHQSIGGVNNQSNALAQLLLGSSYVQNNGYKPTSLDLLDVLLPLTDDPTRDIATDTNLLIYDYDEQSSTGYIDLVHPSGIGQIAYTPKTNQLALRQSSDNQIELYNVASGALERIIAPSEPDPDGAQTLAYTGDGHTLISDFERFDPATGNLLARVDSYTQPFKSYLFNDQNQLITLGGTTIRPQDSLTWRLWDINSGALLRADSIAVNGDTTLGLTDDQLRYLTQTTEADGSVDLMIIDAKADEKQTIHIPVPVDMSFSQVVPNAAWTRFMVVYNANDSNGNVVYPVAVYDRSGKRLYFDAGNNLPNDPISYEWRDDRTIAIETYSDGIQTPPIMGLKYAPSGLPQCVVDALPNSWQSLVPVWELMQTQYDARGLNLKAQQICTALTGQGATNLSAAEGTPAMPPNPTEVVGLLTPSPTSEYLSARTPAPIAVPGVPTCITNRYQRDAVAYADIWRQMTAGITDPAKLAELETMICQGLLSSLGGVQATPTTDPNSLAVVTATPPPDAPQTTGGDQYSYDVMTVDIETGAQTLAQGVVDPPSTPPVDTLKLLNNFFHDQYKVYPNNPVVSPDGQYMAAQNDEGYVMIYRLARPVSVLEQDEQNAIATRAGGNPRSLGLAPTSTPPPQALDNVLPTITPTITLTPVPFTENKADLAQWGDSENICPAPKLYKLPDLPANFNPPGTLLVSPYNTSVNGGLIWTLNPHSGQMVGNDTMPKCNLNESCTPSPDNQWVVRQFADGSVVVSRIDGSDAVTLYNSAQVQLINPSFNWDAPHTLEIYYSGVLPTVSADMISLIRSYNPETGTRTEGALELTPVPLGLLPYDTVSTQPNGALELLAEYAPAGTRYYLRDKATNTSQLLAQNIMGSEWQPAGRFLYYASNEQIYVYDTLTQQNGTLGNIQVLPGGIWSPDGHLRADWTNTSGSDVIKLLEQGKLPPRLQVWDSDTGLMRTYCIPELSNHDPSGVPMLWSPDSRYLAFIFTLPVGGDIAPTPTFAISPEAPPPTNTPIPLQAQYDYSFPRTIILDTASGNAVIVSTEASTLNGWIEK